jgi:hypothetical protein
MRSKKSPTLGGERRARTIRSETLRTFVQTSILSPIKATPTVVIPHLGEWVTSVNLSIGDFDESASFYFLIINPFRDRCKRSLTVLGNHYGKQK